MSGKAAGGNVLGLAYSEPPLGFLGTSPAKAETITPVHALKGIPCGAESCSVDFGVGPASALLGGCSVAAGL